MKNAIIQFNQIIVVFVCSAAAWTVCLYKHKNFKSFIPSLYMCNSEAC